MATLEEKNKQTNKQKPTTRNLNRPKYIARGKETANNSKLKTNQVSALVRKHTEK